MVSQVNNRYLDALAATSTHTITKIHDHKLTSLWAGYGVVSRLNVQYDDGSYKQVILKRVTPRPDSGIGHNRKIKSYQVESQFYSRTEYVQACIAQTRLGLPEPFHITTHGTSEFEFYLSDLSPSYPNSSGDYTLEEAKAALRWLAQFHAFFWGSTAEGLWEEGCYWHLETRQEELAQISREWQQLKDLAWQLDAALKGGDDGGAYRTIVHGDFKSANVVFSPNYQTCAAYDFQYCGGGFGAKDVVYMFCSSVESDVVEGSEEQLLRYYHEQLLTSYLQVHGETLEYPFEMLTEHYNLCFLDYVRFMAGWGFWGNVSWAKKKAKVLLKDVQRLL